MNDMLLTFLLIYFSQLLFILIIIEANKGLLIEQFFIFSSVVVFSCLASARMEAEVRKNFLQSLLLEAEKRDLEKAKEMLHHLSLTDPLTNLSNRRGLEEKIAAVTDPAAELKPEMLARVRFLAPAKAAGARGRKKIRRSNPHHARDHRKIPRSSPTSGTK